MLLSIRESGWLLCCKKLCFSRHLGIANSCSFGLRLKKSCCLNSNPDQCCLFDCSIVLFFSGKEENVVPCGKWQIMLPKYLSFGDSNMDNYWSVNGAGNRCISAKTGFSITNMNTRKWAVLFSLSFQPREDLRSEKKLPRRDSRLRKGSHKYSSKICSFI